MSSPAAPPPPRALPLVYFAAGHVALALALLIPALRPESVAGFFLHPRMLVVVHLVTLGWITTSILGATYIVGTMALRMPLRATKLDWAVCFATIAGASGVASHFLLESYSGVAWSGGLLVVAFVAVTVRILRALAAAKGPLAVRVHVGLAYGNLCLAAVLGTLVAINRLGTILPGNHLPSVFGHAHLAFLGWGTLMVVGVGYRLLPMYLPAAPPAGVRVWATAVLLETGVLGLAASFFLFPAAAPAFAATTAAGIAVFLRNVALMLRDRRPAPPKMRRPDLGMLHTLQAVFYLLLATGLGLFLAFDPVTRPDWIMVYGVFGLLGFLGQVILGIGMRLLPMFSWIESWTGSGFKELPTSPHDMPARPLQYASLALWTVGVPVLAYGLGADVVGMVGLGARLLLGGTLCAGANTVRVVRHAF